jgi:CNT family concentrative nucleoside transporter
MSVFGVFFIVGLCVLVSKERRRIDWKLVLWGVGLQFVVGLAVLKTYPDSIFAGAQAIFDCISLFAAKGARFLFGSLTDQKDFVILSMGATIIFVSSLMAVLNYARIMPALIYVTARVMKRAMGTSGAETLAAIIQILMGIEGVTALKTVIGRLTQSELFTVMTAFTATIAGSVMAVYVNVFGASAGHILAASLMSAPAAIALSKIIIPETGEPETRGKVAWSLLQPPERSLVAAAANGAMDGLRLTVSVAAVLLAFVSLIHLADSALGFLGTSFSIIGGYVFAPVAFILGIPWDDCMKAGDLLALKTVFNEWLAYSRMHEMVLAGELSPRAVTILTYALCSFANFGSLAILIGGISAIAPERRGEVIALSPWALLSGLSAGFLTAAVAGILVE